MRRCLWRNSYAMAVFNKYGLSCAGLTENLLKDIYNNFGLASAGEVDEYLANLEKEGEVE